ncbi:hypothetical protein BKA81DRAFT_141802 [Phyllosticta paracitricarpa]
MGGNWEEPGKKTARGRVVISIRCQSQEPLSRPKFKSSEPMAECRRWDLFCCCCVKADEQKEKRPIINQPESRETIDPSRRCWKGRNEQEKQSMCGQMVQRADKQTEPCARDVVHHLNQPLRRRRMTHPFPQWQRPVCQWVEKSKAENAAQSARGSGKNQEPVK